MRLKRNILSVLFFLGILGSSFAQVSINVIFPTDGLFIADQLYNVTLLNANGNSYDQAYLTVTIEMNGNEPVFNMSTFPFVLPTNSPVFGHTLNWNPQIEYGHNDAAISMRQSGMLPIGRYNFCYRFYTKEGAMISVSCQEVSILGISPPVLTNPYDKDVVSSLPILSWLPPVLSSPIKGIQYSLRLVEKEKGQNKVIALTQNFPLIEQRNLTENQLLYSSDLKQLEIGKTYVWQVGAYANGIDLGKSDIWVFTYDLENKKVSRALVTQSYKLVRRKRDSKYCIGKRELYFSYKNEYNEKELNYTISQAGNKFVRNLPKFDLQAGKNKLVLDCASLNLKKDDYYLLTVTNKKGDKFYLDFLVK